MNILVTGANGFIGSWLVRKLTERGHNVRILARKTSDLSELDGLKYEKSIGDITDQTSIEHALKNIELVYNLAGLIAYKRADRPKMDLVNVQGTANLLAALIKCNVKKLIHMSSVVAIGALQKPNTPLTEKSEYNMSNFNFGYFETKRKSEVLVSEWHELGHGEAMIFNPSTVYGPGDAKKSSRKTQIKVAKGEFNFYSPGGVSIAHVEDVVTTLTNCADKKLNGERYILAGENITIKKLFELIAHAAGVKPPALALPNAALNLLATLTDSLVKFGIKSKLPDSESILVSKMYHWYDSTKAINELSYKTRTAQECINDSVAWMKKNKII